MSLSHSPKIELALGIKELRGHPGYLTMHRHATLKVKEQHKIYEEWANQQGRALNRDWMNLLP